MTRKNQKEEWDRKYNLLLEHAQQNKDNQRYPCHVVRPPRMCAGEVLSEQKKADIELHNFYRTYKSEYLNEHSGMPKYRREKLEALPGFKQMIANFRKVKREVPKKRKQRQNKQWNQKYQELLAFNSEFGHCKVSKGMNRPLYFWTVKQRSLKRKRILDGYRIAKLNELKKWEWSADKESDDASTKSSSRAQSSSDSESDRDDEGEEEAPDLPGRRRGPYAPSPAPSPATVDAADASPNNGASGQERYLSGTDKSDASVTSSNNEEGEEEEAPGSRQNLPNQSSDEDESSTNGQNAPNTDAEDDDDSPTFPMNYDDDDDASPEQNGGSQQHQGQLMQSDSQQDETVPVGNTERSDGAGGNDGNEEGTGAVALLTNCISTVRDSMLSHDERRLIDNKLKELKQLLEQRSATAANDTRNLPANPVRDSSQGEPSDDNGCSEVGADTSARRVSSAARRKEGLTHSKTRKNDHRKPDNDNIRTIAAGRVTILAPGTTQFRKNSPDSSNPKTYRRRCIVMPKLFVDGEPFLKPRPPRPWEKEVTFNMDSSSGSEVEGLPYINSDEEEELEQAGQVDSDDEVVMAGGLGPAVDGSRKDQMDLASIDKNEKVGTVPASRVTRSAARASETCQYLAEDADDEQSVDGEQEVTLALKQGNPTVSNRKRKKLSKATSKKAEDVPTADDGADQAPPKAKRKKRRTGLEDHLRPGPYYLR